MTLCSILVFFLLIRIQNFGTNIGEYVSWSIAENRIPPGSNEDMVMKRWFSEFEDRVKKSNRKVEAPSDSQFRKTILTSRTKGKRRRNAIIGAESRSHEKGSACQGLWFERLSTVNIAALKYRGNRGKSHFFVRHLPKKRMEPVGKEENDAVGGISIPWYGAEQGRAENGLSVIGLWKIIST